MTIKPVIFNFAIVLILWGFCAWGQEVEPPKIVENPNTPKGGVDRIPVVERWRKGGEDSDQLFGLIAQVVGGKDGNIYVLDFLLAKIEVFSNVGSFIRSIDLAGEGPGSARSPINLVSLGPGEFGVLQMFPGKLEIISPEGVPCGTLQPKLSEVQGLEVMHLYDVVPLVDHLLFVGDRLVQRQESQIVLNRLNFVSVYDRSGQELNRIVGHERETSWDSFEYDEETMPYISYRQVSASNTNLIFVADKHVGYEIDVYQLDGSVDRIISREYQSVKRTDSEKAFRLGCGLAQAGLAFNPKINMSKFHKDIETLRISDKGELWVSASNCVSEQEEGVVYSYDIFDEEGTFLRQDEYFIPEAHPSGRLFWLNDSCAAFVTGIRDAMDELDMRRFRIQNAPRQMYDGPMELIIFDVANKRGG